MTTSIQHLNIQANGINFHVAMAGDKNKPPIFCLHGFPEGWMSWRSVMQVLGEDYSVYAPDLRGYPGSQRPDYGYDVFTLTEDIRMLMQALELEKPVLLSHDWGGALGWIFAHRFSHLISRLIVVNCTHPKTLVRAALHFEDFQTLRIPWVPFFQIPFLPEFLLTTPPGRKFLELSFTLREGQQGTMDTGLVDELVERFQGADDMQRPVDYYRYMISTLVWPRKHKRLYDVYETPITVPTTMIWGEKDRALSAKVAMKSGEDAGCPVEWRPLPGVGHFVNLEASDKLIREVQQVLGSPEV